MRGHILTDRPWLATDPTLAPWPGGGNAFQTGTWLLPDDRPLSALAGVPQVVVPHLYDQPYYAQRVADLGIGATAPSVESLATALDRVLQQQMSTIEIRTDGARVAALALSQQ